LKEKSTKERLIFGGNYLLFELSYINAPQNLFDFIKLIQDFDYKPVLAHLERYPFYYGSLKLSSYKRNWLPATEYMSFKPINPLKRTSNLVYHSL